jgi:uncharacterized protein
MSRKSLLFAVLALALSCRNPSPVVTFHTLRAIAQVEAKPILATSPLAVEIMPVQLPELLQRPQVVVREGADSFRLAASHRWGNGLEKDLQRVLAENLAAILGSDAVVPYPLGDRVQAAYRVSVEVQECVGTPNGALRFSATWMVTQPSDGRLLLLRRSSLQEPVRGGAIEELVAAHNRVVYKLGQEIGAGLKGLQEKR